MLARAKRLSVEEIRRLVDDLNAKLEQPDKQEVVSQRRHKARNFRGVGKETWKDVDVEEYLRQERASWVSPTYVEVMDQTLLLSDGDLTRLQRGLDEYTRQEEEKWASLSHMSAIEHNL